MLCRVHLLLGNQMNRNTCFFCKYRAQANTENTNQTSKLRHSLLNIFFLHTSDVAIKSTQVFLQMYTVISQQLSLNECRFFL